MRRVPVTRNYCDEILAQARIFNAAALQTMTFPPLKFILPGLVPEGATLLVSRPKFGKSWLVLDIALATAAGRFTLGELKPSTGDVLYLALEDGRRRLQRRITKLLPTFSVTWPPGMEIATEWPRADQGGLASIEKWLTEHPSARLVIVDTLARFRNLPSGKAQQQLYPEDYAAISGLQNLASKYNVGIIIVHHDRKSEADDVFDTVSGSLGLSAAADTILIMKRQAGAVTLHVRGRDIEEAEMAMQFNKETCRWAILGAAAEVHRSAERKQVLAALDNASGGLGVSEIVAAARLPNRNAAGALLFKMAADGEIERVKRGLYGLPGTRSRIVSDAAEILPSKNTVKIGKKIRSDGKSLNLREDGDDLTNLTDLNGSKTMSAHPATSAASDPWEDLDIPPSLRRERLGSPAERAPALGPPGDSLDDFQ
jgi:AAA domain